MCAPGCAPSPHLIHVGGHQIQGFGHRSSGKFKDGNRHSQGSPRDHLVQGLANTSVRGQVVSVLGSAGLGYDHSDCHCGVKADTGNMQMNRRGSASLAFYLPRESRPHMADPRPSRTFYRKNPDTSPSTTHCNSQVAALRSPLPQQTSSFSRSSVICV